MDGRNGEGFAALLDQAFPQFDQRDVQGRLGRSGERRGGSVGSVQTGASMRPERRSPPRNFGAVRPVRRYSSIQQTALATLTPKRCAAPWREQTPFNGPDHADTKIFG